MFVARAGINTRRHDGQSGLTALLAPKKKNKDQRFYCWVPCMLGPFIGGIVGLAVLLGGAAMCTTGYYAKHFSSTLVSNGSHIVTQVNRSKEFHMYNMTFVGPVIMGCGCFVIIIACVVVCEQRDKDIRIKAEAEKLNGGKQKNKKKEFYNAVVKRLKKSQVYTSTLKSTEADTGQKEPLQNKDKSPAKKFKLMSCLGEAGSAINLESRGQYSHIADALKNIPMEIFSVDMDQKHGSTLLPVRVKSETHLGKSDLFEQKKCRLHKYPSAPCVYDVVRFYDETVLDEPLFRKKSLKRSRSDLCLNKLSNSDSVDELASKPDKLMLKHNSDASISRTMCSNVTESAIVAIDGAPSTKSPNQHEGSLNGPSQSLSSGSQLIQCQASVHPEQHDTTECQSTGDISKGKHSTATLPNANQAQVNLAQDQYRGNKLSIPDQNRIDTELLAITSGIARANAMGMDMFRKTPVKDQTKHGRPGGCSTVVCDNNKFITKPMNMTANLENNELVLPEKVSGKDYSKKDSGVEQVETSSGEATNHLPIYQNDDSEFHSRYAVGLAGNLLDTNTGEAVSTNTQTYPTDSDSPENKTESMEYQSTSEMCGTDDVITIPEDALHGDQIYSANPVQNCATSDQKGHPYMHIRQESSDSLQTSNAPCVKDHNTTTEHVNAAVHVDHIESQPAEKVPEEMSSDEEMEVFGTELEPCQKRGSDRNSPCLVAQEDGDDRYTSFDRQGSPTSNVKVSGGGSGKPVRKQRQSEISEEEDLMVCVDI